ncbi:MAG: PDZ domain-containing protein [Aquincola sp.]|nr:PDZ domain-containing protein [Aquincola sp.]MDH5329660.1 PDZ domain-containing protein [Aquincola sp.]
MPTAPIRYRVELHDLHAHQFRITLTVARPAAAQRLSLPVWIPGSYMVREFGRHVFRMEALQGARPVTLKQLDKTTWQAECGTRGPLTVSYLVYAFDTSVRTAFLDASRGFFNGTSLFLRVEGQEGTTHRVSISGLPRGWTVATAMRREGLAHVAADYDELVDHPFELGRFWRGGFKAHGVAHEFVVTGAWPGFDGDRLVADARRICETQIEFWHGTRKPKPPFDRYVFLLNAVDDGYGGLEHRASTALIARRRELPQVGVTALTEGYVTLLGLISHEYFHAWNVKRLRPAALASIDYARENYTDLLWFFEGFTSYYDDLLLLRAGAIDAPRYLGLVSKTLNGVAATPGRHVQSVAQASFDAWVKYYRSDENTPNATVSYYTKGALVALAFDLTLRREGRGTLDAVMRQLWVACGGACVSEADIAVAFEAVGGRPYSREIASWVHGTADLPVPSLLEAFGIEMHRDKPGFAAALGLRVVESGAGILVKQVLAGSPAARAGVSAGDELLAVDGWRLRRLDEAQQWLVPGAAFELLVVRDQRLVTLTLKPDPTPSHVLALRPAAAAPKAVAALRRAWIGT